MELFSASKTNARDEASETARIIPSKMIHDIITKAIALIDKLHVKKQLSKVFCCLLYMHKNKKSTQSRMVFNIINILVLIIMI